MHDKLQRWQNQFLIDEQTKILFISIRYIINKKIRNSESEKKTLIITACEVFIQRSGP